MRWKCEHIESRIWNWMLVTLLWKQIVKETIFRTFNRKTCYWRCMFFTLVRLWLNLCIPDIGQGNSTWWQNGWVSVRYKYTSWSDLLSEKVAACYMYRHIYEYTWCSWLWLCKYMWSSSCLSEDLKKSTIIVC